MTAGTYLLAVHCALSSAGPAQALPPPRDGDIRVLYWELTDQTEVWLTLEPKSPDGKPFPPAMSLTFTLHFAGKRPAKPPEHVELRAHTGTLWSPRVELWLALDGEKIEMTSLNQCCLAGDGVWQYVSARVPMALLERIARANRVSGNALRLEFELTASQREAVRAFLDRVSSGDPARLAR